MKKTTKKSQSKFVGSATRAKFDALKQRRLANRRNKGRGRK